ncbi:MAG: hypothetical protein AABY05_02565 [Nanoarchaeota archaeon]
MAVDVKKLIGAINPSVYCDEERDKAGKKLSSIVSDIAKKEGYLKAAAKVKLKESDMIDVKDEQFKKGAFSLLGLKYPMEKHEISYDATSQSLEQIYFWILDSVNKDYGESEKLIDNFVSSPGSGHFAEMSRRSTILQDEAMKIFGTINTVIRSVLNLIYDLKEFKLRLSEYENLKSKDKRVKNSALLSLKQIWLDSVDIKRQTSSIKGFAQNFDYVTIIDAFMTAGSSEDVEKLDLNDRVKKILQQRLPEFLKWTEESEKELNKRFEIEKIYLKSQVNSLRLYSRWLKPLLRSARSLEQNMNSNSSLVNFFNTSLFELVLLGKGRYDPKDDVSRDELPKVFLNLKTRKYTPIVLVELSFRSIPDKVDQRGGYMFRGRADISFSSFALNEDELSVLKQEIEKDDMGDVLKLIMGSTSDSLDQINSDIENLIGGKDQGKKENKEESGDVNPFSALFSGFKKEDKAEKKDLSKGIPGDSEYEKVLRSQAILGARFSCEKLYSAFKKSYGWPTI